jgi:hypothetical protein
MEFRMYDESFSALILIVFVGGVLSMICSLMLIQLGRVLRHSRIKPGLCPACAYPVGSSPVCTECGKPLPLPLGEGRGEGIRVSR